MKRIFTAMPLVLALAFAAHAGQLDKARVPADATWLAHVDVQGMVQSQLGSSIITDLRGVGLDDKVDMAEAMIGVNPLKDVDSITAYGTDFDHANAVMIVELTADLSQLEALATAAKGYELHRHGDYVVHSWLDKQRHGHHRGPLEGVTEDNVRKYCGVYPTKGQAHLLIFSETKAQVAAALDRLAGNGKGLSGSTSKALNATPAKGAFFFMAAEGFDKLEHHPAKHSAMVNASKSITFEFGEYENYVFSNLTVVAKTADQAMHLKTAAEGMLALAKFAGAEGPTPMSRLAGAVDVSVNGDTATARFNYAAEKLYEEMKEMHRIKQEMRKGQ